MGLGVPAAKVAREQPGKRPVAVMCADCIAMALMKRPFAANGGERYFGTKLAYDHSGSRRRAHYCAKYRKKFPAIEIDEECIMAMGNRAIWAILWVIGIPLPILVVLYFLTGGGCS